LLQTEKERVLLPLIARSVRENCGRAVFAAEPPAILALMSWR